MKHYASRIGKIFSIIWKAFCLMQIFRKILRLYLCVKNARYYINISGSTIKGGFYIEAMHFHETQASFLAYAG